MSEKKEIYKLAGKDLSGFKIVEMTEVYMVNEDGRYSKSLGFFKDPTIATAFAGSQTDASYHKTGKRAVLTDGKLAFLLEEKNSVHLFDDEAEALRVKEKALAKLSPEERKLLGH